MSSYEKELERDGRVVDAEQPNVHQGVVAILNCHFCTCVMKDRLLLLLDNCLSKYCLVIKNNPARKNLQLLIP